jgi:hypothetical protein
VNAKTATTASFSPQAGTLLVLLAGVLGANNAATTVVVTDSLSGVWSLLKRQNTNSGVGVGGSAEVWCRYLASAPGTMTVTAAWSTGLTGGDVVVRCLLGAASTQTGATGGTGGDSVAPTATLTPTVLGSWVYGACEDWTSDPLLVANAVTTAIDQFDDTSNGDVYGIFKGTVATAALVSTAYGFTNANAGFNTAAAEILPAGATAAQPSPLIIGQAVGRASLW